MSWWWAGAVGAAMKQRPETRYNSVALVVGATGIVGSSLVSILPLPDTPGGPWKVYALSRRDPPAWVQSSSFVPVRHIKCDLTDAGAAAKILGVVAREITHIFYVTTSTQPTEDEQCRVNTDMLHTLLSAVLPAAPKLQHVCLQSGRMYYTGPPGTEKGGIVPHEPPFTEDMSPLSARNFYGDLERVLKEELGGKQITWSIHRPSTVFGYSPRSSMNLIGSLCAYAAICKKEGLPLKWPGSQVAWEGFSDASDADLVAEQQIWAAIEDPGKNEVFNCTNGDVFKWKRLWPELAKQFGLDYEGYTNEFERFRLAKRMSGKEQVWKEIVMEKGLRDSSIDDVEIWPFADYILNLETEQLDSMNKSKEYSFLGFRNTVNSFNDWIVKMKQFNIVP